MPLPRIHHSCLGPAVATTSLPGAADDVQAADRNLMPLLQTLVVYIQFEFLLEEVN